MGLAIACSKVPDRDEVPVRAAEQAAPGSTASDSRPDPSAKPSASTGCGGGRRLTVHFYDVGEALAALVDLPDGRHILVDAGDGRHRARCGDPCETAGRHLIEELRGDLRGSPVNLLWITHQHADHIGGAPEVIDTFRTGVYVDNGRDTSKPEVRRARAAADSRGTTVSVVDPDHRELPFAGSRDVRLTPVVPRAWPGSCSRDPNECSIALRIDFCSSSLLFTGDAEHDEEAMLDPQGPATLLQVAHHGSETSTTPGFLARVKPKYAVISAGKPREGYNRSFCHPRARIVQRLTRVLAGAAAGSIEAFDGDRCERSVGSDWTKVPTSEFLWATERDGDVRLATTGDGVFRREPQ